MPELGQLLSLEYGDALPAEQRAGHGFPVFGSNGEVGRHHQPLVDGPGIVVGRKGSVGKVCWSEDAFWPIDTTYWVKCAAKERRWIYWLLSRLPLSELDSSTGVPGLNRNDVYELTVFEPPTTDEKSRIAEILDTLDTTIRQTEAIIEKLKQVKQGLLHDLLTRGIDANGELRPPQSQAPHRYKDSPLGWIPREWRVETLPALALGGLMNGVFKEPKRVGSGVALVNVADLYRGQNVDLGRCERFAATAAEIDRYGARRGDIFFTRSSLKLEGIAQTSFLDDEPDGAVFECHVMRLRPNPELAAPRFLKEWCVARNARTHFMSHAKQVTMTTISQDGISSLRCPVPPLPEQVEAVKRISAVDGRAAAEANDLRKARLLRSGLMDDLLTGRVRVTPLLPAAAA